VVAVSFARGTVVDQDALVEALKAGHIHSAFLDVTTPEPLPGDHPLWDLPNAHVTMHLSGRAQDKMFIRSVDRFLVNLERYRKGEALEPMVDLLRGY
jgi:phosphoglycerate dehydrogenase-like enzyme